MELFTPDLLIRGGTEKLHLRKSIDHVESESKESSFFVCFLKRLLLLNIFKHQIVLISKSFLTVKMKLVMFLYEKNL